MKWKIKSYISSERLNVQNWAEDLPEAEEYKNICGKKHFDALETDYEVVTSECPVQATIVSRKVYRHQEQALFS